MAARQKWQRFRSIENRLRSDFLAWFGGEHVKTPIDYLNHCEKHSQARISRSPIAQQSTGWPEKWSCHYSSSRWSSESRSPSRTIWTDIRWISCEWHALRFPLHIHATTAIIRTLVRGLNWQATRCWPFFRLNWLLKHRSKYHGGCSGPNKMHAFPFPIRFSTLCRTFDCSTMPCFPQPFLLSLLIRNCKFRPSL